MAEPAGMSHAWRGRVGMIGLIIAGLAVLGVLVAYLHIGKEPQRVVSAPVLELPVLGTMSPVEQCLRRARRARWDGMRGCGVAGVRGAGRSSRRHREWCP
jgi:hypothetical protein